MLLDETTDLCTLPKKINENIADVNDMHQLTTIENPVKNVCMLTTKIEDSAAVDSIPKLTKFGENSDISRAADVYNAFQKNKNKTSVTYSTCKLKSLAVAHKKINDQRSIGVQTSQKQIKPHFRSKATSCDLPTVCGKMSTDRGCSPINFSKQRSIVSTSSSSIES